MSRKPFRPYTANPTRRNRLTPYKKTLRAVLERDQSMCQFCNKQGVTTMDYVVHPLNGGRQGYANRVACCPPCQRKRKNTVHESKDLYIITRNPEM